MKEEILKKETTKKIPPKKPLHEEESRWEDEGGPPLSKEYIEKHPDKNPKKDIHKD